MQIKSTKFFKENKIKFLENEEEKAQDSIDKIIDMDWGKDDKNQGIFAELVKGLSFSQSDKANKFLDKINKYTNSLKDEFHS